jgi:ubiquinone/menaquinone biosynthesis C-methylase UbiE
MKGLDRVRARYAGKASQEWERLTATPITRIEYLITSHWLQRYLPPSGTVLDAGSGPGRYAIDLARRGYRVVVFDLLRDMLQLGRQKAAQAGVGPRSVTPTEGDLAALPYADNAFDAVVSLGAPLSHITDTDAQLCAIAEMARVVKPGQPVFLTVCARLAAYRGIAFWMDLGGDDAGRS